MNLRRAKNRGVHLMQWLAAQKRLPPYCFDGVPEMSRLVIGLLKQHLKTSGAWLVVTCGRNAGITRWNRERS